MRNCIKTNHILILTLACLLSFAGLAAAEDTAVERALETCKPEIESYCSQVTPGEGRLLACFMAHEDKLSGQCNWALYEAMDELEAFINAVGYLAESCWDDMEKHCGEVELGEGRVEGMPTRPQGRGIAGLQSGDGRCRARGGRGVGRATARAVLPSK